jgi:hypothetical protein
VRARARNARPWAIDTRELRVDEDSVRGPPVDHHKRGGQIGRGAEDHHVVLRVQHREETDSRDRLLLDDDEANGFGEPRYRYKGAGRRCEGFRRHGHICWYPALLEIRQATVAGDPTLVDLSPT